MLRIIRGFNVKKPCALKNMLQGCKPSAPQIVKMSASSDVFKENIIEDNLREDGKYKAEKDMDVEYKFIPEGRSLKIQKELYLLSPECPSNFFFQNKENLLRLIMAMTTPNAVTFMKNICSSKSRPMDILNALSAKLKSSPPKTLLDCSAVLYYAAILSFRDVELTRIIGQQIIEKKAEFTSHKLPINIIKSLGVLKYNDKELITVLLDVILQHKSDSPDDVVSCLNALAAINFDSPSVELLSQLLIHCNETDFTSPESYLSFVWSCVILNKYNPEQISRVLSDEFSHKVQGTDKENVSLLRLQNIHGAATNLIKNYEGPLLMEKFLSTPSSPKSKKDFVDAVKNTLSYICPNEGFLKFNINTNAGFLIDVCCSVNQQGQIVKMKQNSEHKKVAILLMDYHSYCLGGQDLTGISMFKKKISEAQGYKTLVIPYTEFQLSARLSEKIEYIRKKLKTMG